MDVLVASQVRLFREGLRSVLRRDGRLQVIATVETGGEVVAASRTHRAQAVLLDMGSPGAVQAISDLRSAIPEIRVIAIGLEEVESQVLACAEAGVAGYLRPDASVEELVRTVERAVRHELSCSKQIAGALLDRVADLSRQAPRQTGTRRLTPREVEIVKLLDKGLSNKQIAGRLTIELSTVKNHVHNILDKLDADSRWQAAAKAKGLAELRRRP